MGMLNEAKFTWLPRILKWFWRGLVIVLILALVTLTAFSFFTFTRERQTPEQAAPAVGRFVSGGDVNIYVQEDGPKNGLPVVFINGFGAWSETWKKTTAVLASQGFYTIALDMPPFGFSEKITNGNFSRAAQAQRIINVLDSLGLKQVVLVGHSVGGRPTVEAALISPDRVKALVLVDAALGFGNNGEFEQKNARWWEKLFFAIHPIRNSILSLTATNPLMTKKLLSTFVADPGVLTPELLAVYQKPFVVKDSTNRLGDWLKVLSIDKDRSKSSNFANFSELAMPTLLIWGSKDTVTPLWQGQKLNMLIPGSVLNVLSGPGHIPQIEDVKQFNNSLLPFLEQLKK